MSKELITDGEDFVVEYVDRNYGGVRRTILQASGKDGSIQMGNLSITAKGQVNIIGGTGQLDAVGSNQILYVNAATGSDFNPGTVGLPLATLDAAMVQVSAGRQQRRIYLQAGTYTPAAKEYVIPSAIGGLGEPLSILGDTTVVETGTIASFQTTNTAGIRNFVRTTPTTPAIGGAITFTSGACAGIRLTICQDDGTNVILNNAPANFGTGANPAIGDSYIVERPASIINVVGTVTFKSGIFALKNVVFSSTLANQTMRFADGANCVSVENVEIDVTNLIFVLFGATLRTASDDRGFQAPAPFSLSLRRSCGLYVHGNGAIGFVADQNSFIGQSTGGGLVISTCSQFNIVSGSVLHQASPPPCTLNSCIRVTGGATALIDGATNARGTFIGSPSATVPQIIVQQSNVSLRRIELVGSLTDGLQAGRMSRIFADFVRGAGHAGYGLNVQGGSTIELGGQTFPAGASSTTTTGAGTTPSNTITAGIAAVTTTLTDNPLAANATTVNVAATTGFPTAGSIRVDSEIISYTGTTGTSLTGCTRGDWYTTAATHVSGTTAKLVSGSDTMVGAIPKTYAVLNGTTGYSEVDAGGPTGNRVAIQQTSN